MPHPLPRLLSGTLALLLAAPLLCHAEKKEDDWNVGIAVAARSPLYAGEGTQLHPFPYVYHEGKHFYVKGPMAGWKFYDNDTFSVSAFVGVSFDGVDRKDFGRRALAAHGINRDLLKDRSIGLDGGIAATLSSESAGELELQLRSDISGHSKGETVSLDYSYPFQIGSVAVVPGVGATALTRQYADYYYGTLPSEVARGVPDYKPGCAIVPHAHVTVIAPFGEHWSGLLGLNVDVLPKKITDSPLLEDDTKTVPVVFAGVSRSF
jgi:outer membrane protein